MSWNKGKPFSSEKSEVQNWAPTGAPRPMIAKKDFVIQHNIYRREIKVGDDVSDVPKEYHENLKTEGVI